MSNTIRFVVLILIFTFMAGFYIVPTREMPDNALVFLDDRNRTYISPRCSGKERQEFRPATAAEARRLQYEAEAKCLKESGFSQDARSVSGNFLVRLGMLPPLPSRWNADGTWNW